MKTEKLANEIIINLVTQQSGDIYIPIKSLAIIKRVIINVMNNKK